MEFTRLLSRFTFIKYFSQFNSLEKIKLYSYNIKYYKNQCNIKQKILFSFNFIHPIINQLYTYTKNNMYIYKLNKINEILNINLF